MILLPCLLLGLLLVAVAMDAGIGDTTATVCAKFGIVSCCYCYYPPPPCITLIYV